MGGAGADPSCPRGPPCTPVGGPGRAIPSGVGQRVSRRAALRLSALGISALGISALGLSALGVSAAGSVLARRGPALAPPLDEGLPPRAVVVVPAAGSGEAPALQPVPGTVRGTGTRWAPMAARALADLRALDGPFPLVVDTADHRTVSAGIAGAAIAAWRPAWRHVWPRDASFVVAALTTSGEPARAGRVLDFLARVAPADGRWQARYLPDGSGRAPDGRGVQADSAGWVCWAVWSHTVAHTVTRSRADPADRPARRPARQQGGPNGGWAGPADVRRWWPMLATSADRMASSLDGSGEPPPSPDYWEVHADRVTLETVTALLVGLRSATALASALGRTDAAARWSVAAGRVAGTLREAWAPRGYPRTLPRGGADAAVGLLAAFAPDLPGLPAAVTAAAGALALPNGGVRPGEDWPHDDGIAWTPEVAMLALGAARTDARAAGARLDWLDRHRAPSGALPEKVAADGSPSSVAPLGWSSALVLLALQSVSAAPVVPPA